MKTLLKVFWQFNGRNSQKFLPPRRPLWPQLPPPSGKCGTTLQVQENSPRLGPSLSEAEIPLQSASQRPSLLNRRRTTVEAPWIRWLLGVLSRRRSYASGNKPSPYRILDWGQPCVTPSLLNRMLGSLPGLQTKHLAYSPLCDNMLVCKGFWQTSGLVSPVTISFDQKEKVCLISCVTSSSTSLLMYHSIISFEKRFAMMHHRSLLQLLHSPSHSASIMCAAPLLSLSLTSLSSSPSGSRLTFALH